VAEKHPDISVFWIPAQSSGALLRATENIAQQLGIRSAANQSEDVQDLLKRHLSAPSARRWLLIVDKADDTGILEPSSYSDGLLRYLPESSSGMTVFTTRSYSYAQRLAGSHVLRLKKPTKEEAANLLEMALPDNYDLCSDPMAVTKLLTDLGHMPPAITKAADYINDNEISIREYSRRFPSTGSATSSALDNGKQKTQTRHRRVPVSYAYPTADTSTAQYTPHDIDLPQNLPASSGHSQGPKSTTKLTGLWRIKTCYLLIAIAVLAIGGSLAVGVFYSVSEDRMGDGFTTAGWMVAVSTLVLAAPMAKHYPHCRCWNSHRTAML
jgi:hypothetical protein